MPAADRVHGARRVLAGSLLAISALSVPVFCTRFLNDMDYYTLVSHKLLRGGILYRDAIDTKPPFVFLHYAAIFKLFGLHNVAAVKTVTMVCLVLSSLLILAIHKALFSRSSRHELAAMLFVLASFSGWGEDFLSSNTEILSNLFVLAGVWCMVSAEFSRSALHLLSSGMLVGIAFLYRYQAGTALAAYFVMVVAMWKQFDRPLWRLLMLGVGWMMPIALVVAYYNRIGALGDLIFLMRYQSFYVRAHEPYWPQVLGQVAIIATGQGPFIILAASQARRMARRPIGKPEAFLLSFLFFSVLPFFVGGHYFAHYIVQAIPAMVLLATERLPVPHVSPDETRTEPFFLRHARSFIFVTVALFWVVNTAYYAALPAAPPDPNLVRLVQSHTAPHDRVFLWTERPQILFEIDRVYATRFLTNEFLTGRAYGSRYRGASATADSARRQSIPELWPALLQDLQIEKPLVIIDDAPDRSNFTIDHYPPLLPFVRTYYEPGRLVDGFSVYLRKAG